MKKVLLFAVIAMFLMVPMSFAKTAISEGDLASLTAQEGVTINFDCFTVGAITINTQSWGDGDGCTGCAAGKGYTDEGWVGASITLSSDFVTITGNLTVDVGTSGSVTALAVGLPTLNLVGSQTQVVKLAGNADLNSNVMILGTSYVAGMTVTPKGALIIHAH